MSVAELLRDLRAREVKVWVDGDKLRFHAPPGAVSPQIRDRLQRHKAELIGFLGGVDAGVPFADLQSIPVIPREGPLGLSAGQQRLWFIEQLAPGPAYNSSEAAWLRGPLDEAALQDALDLLVQRHEILRTTYRSERGEPQQVIGPPRPVEVRFTDLSLDAEGYAAELNALLVEEARRPFQLDRDLMIRASVYRGDGEANVLLLVVHHIACDGWSMGILFEELAEHYSARVAARPSNAADLRVQYADYAAWQGDFLGGDLIERLSAAWERELDGCNSVLDLPTDYPRPALQSFDGALETFDVPATTVAGLRSLTRAEGATDFMAMLTAVYVLLHRYTGQDDIVVGSPVGVFNRFDLEPVIGLWLNTIPMRADLSDGPTGRELLRRVRDGALRAFEHQDLPFDRVVELVKPVRDPGRNPLFQVMFVQQLKHRPSRSLTECGFAVEPIDLDDGTSKLDLTISIAAEDDYFAGWIEYGTRLFEKGTIERMCDHLLTVAKGVAETPDTPVTDLPMLSESERQAMLVGWNATGRPLPNDPIHELISAQAERTPSAVAVTASSGELTYRELEVRSRALAARLVAAGVGPGTLAAVYLERSCDMIVSLLGTLRAGGAYLPLDPTHPTQRLDFILREAAPKVVLVRSDGPRPDSTTDIPVIVVDDLSISGGDGPPLPSATLDDLAYTIYTSGSTGKPKGVEIPHRALSNLLLSMKDEPGFDETDVLLAVTTLSFDIAALELLLPLVVGGRTVIVDDEAQSDPRGLIRAIDDAEPTVMQATPATWRLLVESGWEGRPTLRILSGGEPLPSDLAKSLLGRGASVWNMYGPTETTIWSTCTKIVDGDDITIGRPIANTRVYVLDREGRPVPPGVTGELYIGGHGVATGYVSRPELTSERFMADPFHGAGSRMYRTGDAVRFRGDGRLEYVERTDHQVKVHGFRIELEEIEAVLREHPEVINAAAVSRDYGDADQRLFAYVVTDPGGMEPTGTELREHLSQQLPTYMIPAFLMTVDALPLTPNGKVDRESLPDPAFFGMTGRGAMEPPQTETEILLADVWRDILRIDEVGLDDNFFDLGGVSLLSMRAIVESEHRTGVRLDFRDMVLQTLRQISAKCDRGRANA